MVKARTIKWENAMCRVFALMGCVFLLGCSEELKTGKESVSAFSVPTDRVFLIDTQKFPAEAAGVWENEEYGWIFRIEKDGRLSKIRHTIGRTELKAGEISIIPLINNGTATIKPGPWYVQYTGQDNMITIEINIKEFVYDIGGGNMVKGSSRDVFMGPLPQKGDDRWVLTWLSFPEYFASTGDREFLNYKLPFEAGDEDKGDIVFQRIYTIKE